MLVCCSLFAFGARFVLNDRCIFFLARKRKGEERSAPPPLRHLFLRQAVNKCMCLPPPFDNYHQMCEMAECLSRRTWLTDKQLSAVSGAFSGEVCASVGGSSLLKGRAGYGNKVVF